MGAKTEQKRCRKTKGKRSTGKDAGDETDPSVLVYRIGPLESVTRKGYLCIAHQVLRGLSRGGVVSRGGRKRRSSTEVRLTGRVWAPWWGKIIDINCRNKGCPWG